MGSFYVNITVRGPTQDQLLNYLVSQDRNAYVSPTVNEFTVIWDEEIDEQNIEIISSLASKVSKHYHCPALAFLNHDDDILWYQLYEAGKLTDQYDSTPGYFDEDADPSPPSGGNASILCEAFAIPLNIGRVEAILRKSCFDDGGYVFALDRHRDLANAIGMPSFSVGLGYSYLDEGDLPAELFPSPPKHT
jgi:hypothetical protein